jgi:hypothetical protein
MARKSSKQENVQHVTLLLNGGLNYSQSSANIADNELQRAMNFIYDPSTDVLVTRPGTKCVTASALPSQITKGYFFQNSVGGYHICAAGKKLYKIETPITGGGVDTYTEIGTDLLTGTYVPAFLTFHDLLLIADGDTGIKTWNGTITATISGSPKATVLATINNRVVANSIGSGELDAVYFSASENEAAWSTGAVSLRAGFGDLLSVNSFGIFGDDLIVSKVGLSAKRLYRVNTAGATTDWYVQELSQNNASQNAHAMLGAWNNVFFVDTNGFKSIKGTDTYGDLEVDPIGRKINAVFALEYTCDGLNYLPSYNTLWFNISDKMYCYTERYDATTGKIISAFTDLYFQFGRCTSAYEADDEVFLTGYNGYLYKLDEAESTDEVSPGTTEEYPCLVRTKTLTFFVDGILRKLGWYLKPKADGTGILNIRTAENDTTVLKTVTLVDEGLLLFDATGEFSTALNNDITSTLYSTGTSPWVETSRNRIRHHEMTFELQVDTGRCGVEWVKAEIALLEGGE